MPGITLQQRKKVTQWLLGALLLCGTLAVSETIRPQGTLRSLVVTTYRNLKNARLQAASAAHISPLTRFVPEGVYTLYSQGLQNGWQNWSWPVKTVTPLPAGGLALSLSPVGNQGLYLHHSPFTLEGYAMLELSVRGQVPLLVRLVDSNDVFLEGVPLTSYLTARTSPDWQVARIPLTALGAVNANGVISGIIVQAVEAGATSAESVLLEKIALLPAAQRPTVPDRVTIPVEVDATTASHPISPYIYGMAFASPEYVKDLRLSVNRWGGNDKTRYNWVHGNADNAARDWRWANRPAIGDPHIPTGPSAAADWFVAQNRSAGSATLLTVPTIGWVAKNADNGTTSQAVPAMGGAPLSEKDTTGAIAGYDPTANREHTSVPSFPRKGKPFTDAPPTDSTAIFQDEWVHHLKKRFGAATEGGVTFLAMDNEPDLWDQTHTDVHPVRLGYDTMFAQFHDYATAVKAVDPTVQVTGPVVSGWNSLLYSSLDRGTDNFRTHADRKAHGDTPFLLWFLQQAQAADRAAGGQRTLDVLDVHFYPQGAGLFRGDTIDPGTRARRVRATRALWDAQYVDESWIGQAVRLLPQLKEWVATGYPGTDIGVTEWNFGGDTDVSGGLAIAETLGRFGQEDVYLANYWAFPVRNSPGYLAFKLYRNADGRGNGFGDVAYRTHSTQPEALSLFAAREKASGTLTLILVNKMPQTTAQVPVLLTEQSMVAAKVPVAQWQLSGTFERIVASTPEIALTPVAGEGKRATFQVTVPPYSVTLLRLPVSSSQIPADITGKTASRERNHTNAGKI